MKKQRSNVKFNYLYRDAANYKVWGSIIFSNPENISIAEVEATMKKNLIDGDCFDPKEWNIPALSFADYDSFLDHDWNEYYSLEKTSEKETDKKTVSEFLKGLKVSH